MISANNLSAACLVWLVAASGIAAAEPINALSGRHCQKDFFWQSAVRYECTEYVNSELRISPGETVRVVVSGVDDLLNFADSLEFSLDVSGRSQCSCTVTLGEHFTQNCFPKTRNEMYEERAINLTLLERSKLKYLWEKLNPAISKVIFIGSNKSHDVIKVHFKSVRPGYVELISDMPVHGLEFEPGIKVLATAYNKWRPSEQKYVSVVNVDTSFAKNPESWIYIHVKKNTLTQKGFFLLRAFEGVTDASGYQKNGEPVLVELNRFIGNKKFSSDPVILDFKAGENGCRAILESLRFVRDY